MREQRRVVRRPRRLSDPQLKLELNRHGVHLRQLFMLADYGLTDALLIVEVCYRRDSSSFGLN